jgi:hypothetical protein
LLQVNITQPLNEPVLDHVDLIGGDVTGLVAPGSANYAGAWPRNFNWLAADGSTPVRAADGTYPGVPVAAQNTSAKILKTFSNTLESFSQVTVDGVQYIAMTYTITGASKSQFVRLRGSNLPASVPFETDASGNPLSDIFTNAITTANLKIKCNTVGTNVPPLSLRAPYTGNTIDGCPTHLPVIAGQKYVAYDVAAWADLWFYSNPIYIEVVTPSAAKADVRASR